MVFNNSLNKENTQKSINQVRLQLIDIVKGIFAQRLEMHSTFKTLAETLDAEASGKTLQASREQMDDLFDAFY